MCKPSPPNGSGLYTFSYRLRVVSDDFRQFLGLSRGSPWGILGFDQLLYAVVLEVPDAASGAILVHCFNLIPLRKDFQVYGHIRGDVSSY